MVCLKLKPLLTILFAVICSWAPGNETRHLQRLNDAFQKPSKTSPYFYQDSVKFNKSEDKKKPVRFGLKAGVNYSNMNFNKGYSGVMVPLEPAWKTGISFGLIMQVHILGRLFVSQEYFFSRVRGQFKPFEAEYTFDYVSFPVLLNYKVSPKFIVAMGPQLELLLQGKEKIHGQTFTVTQMTEERSIGLNLCLIYLSTDKVNLSTRFMHGFNHIGIYQRIGRREFKYELIQVSANILF